MGATHNEFVPAAILLENPGISLEELDARIRQVGPFNDYQFKMIGDNSVRGYSLGIFTKYNKGQMGLAQEVLSMPIRAKSIIPNPRDILEIGRLEVVPRLGDNCWLEPEYLVNTYLGNRLEREHVARMNVFKNFRKGQRIRKMAADRAHYYLNGQRVDVPEDNQNMDCCEIFIVEDILETGKSKVAEQDVRYQVLRLKLIVPEYKQERFESLEELAKAYPSFSLDRLFDFSQDSGELSRGNRFNAKMRWMKKNGRYYLDTKSILDIKSLGIYDWLHGDFVYGSIALTAEAIKHKEWEMLEYCSGDERPGILAKFLVGHPESKARHDNLVMQFYDCKDACMRELSNAEWLRERAIEAWRRGLSPEQAKKEHALVCEEAPELIRIMEGKRKYLRRCFSEKVDRSGEPPF
jgi:hypothetical protein